jgi:hypothetical protein
MIEDFHDTATDPVLTGSAGVPADPLPLLSHALALTWRCRERGALTLAGYLAAGGLRHGVARSADAVFGSIAAPHRELAARMFRALIRVDDDVVRSRRGVPRVALRAALADAAGEVDLVVDRFAAEGLLTADNDTVEITHDAVRCAWPRLLTWSIEDQRRSTTLSGRP